MNGLCSVILFGQQNSCEPVPLRKFRKQLDEIALCKILVSLSP